MVRTKLRKRKACVNPLMVICELGCCPIFMIHLPLLRSKLRIISYDAHRAAGRAPWSWKANEGVARDTGLAAAPFAKAAVKSGLARLGRKLSTGLFLCFVLAISQVAQICCGWG